MTRIVSGFDELESVIRRLPKEAAKRLQSVVIANHLDHRNEVIASSDLSAEAKRSMKFAIRVLPGGGGSSSSRERVVPKSLDDVTGETVSFWKGPHTSDPADGTAARIEKSIGKKTLRPKRRQYLLIPQGDFLTPSGRPRRTRTAAGLVPIDMSKLPNTNVIEIRGKKLMVQRLQGGAVGMFERESARQRKTKLGSVKRLGERWRVVGALVKQAKGFTGLDFFGSWQRLEGKRTARYDSLMNELVGL